MPGILEAVIRRSLAAVLALPLALAGLLLASSPADAAAGTWGAGHYRFAEGAICKIPGSGAPNAPANYTVPFAAWDVSGGRGYLMRPISSDGTRDSAAPPVSAAGTPTVSDVVPGQYGFTSAQDIAAFAAVLNSGGSAKAIAAAVYARFGPAPAQCGISDDGVTQRGADQAGPYRVAVQADRKQVELGQAATVTATVTTASGHPVSGVKVTFSAGSGNLGPSEVWTDGAGHASTSITAPTGSNLDSVGVTAQASAATGLKVVTVAATPSATNPTGASVAAIVAAGSSTAQGAVTVPVDMTASPVLHTATDSRGVALGQAFVASAKVTGMRGHTGQAQFSILGPVSPDAHGDCTNVKFSQQTPVAARTDTVTIVGDRTFTASGWQPGKVGCYLTVAHLNTIDARPAVTAASGFDGTSAIVTVINVSGKLVVPHAVSGPSGLAASVTPVNAEGRTVAASATLAGPVRPRADGSCADADFGGAPKHEVDGERADTSAPGAAADALDLKAPDVSAGGCYRWTPTLAVAVEGVGRVTVPVAGSGATVLVMTPQVSVSADQVWSTTPNAVTAHVRLLGTYGHAAHVTLGLQYVPTPPKGCSYADFSHAKTAADGPSAAVKAGQDTAVAKTGAMPDPGCYNPVATVAMDEDTSITGKSTFDAANTIGAGVPLANAVDAAPQDKPSGRAADGGSQTRAFVAFGSFVGLELVIAIVIAIQAWLRRGRRPSSGQAILDRVATG